MGTYPELLPGGVQSSNKKRLGELGKAWGVKLSDKPSQWNAESLFGKKKLKVLYLVGEAPPVGSVRAEYVISQNIYPPGDTFDADLVLPTAAFTESDGTFINGEGRVQRVHKAAEPPGHALPDWEILCRIARKMGKSGFKFSSASQVYKELSGLVDGFGSFNDKKRKSSPLNVAGRLKLGKSKSKTIKKTDKSYPYLLTTSMVEHTHRGFPLSAWVDGTRKIFQDGTVAMKPDDARKARVKEGDIVLVKSAYFEKRWPVRILPDQPSGTVHATLHHGEILCPTPHPVKIRKTNV